MKKISNKVKDDIVEELDEEFKQREEYWRFNKSLKENYDILIKSYNDIEMNIRFECLSTGQYQIIVSAKEYVSFFPNKKYKTFGNFNEAKIYFEMLKNKYGGIKKLEAEKIEWDNHSIFWKIGRTFKDMLWDFS